MDLEKSVGGALTLVLDAGKTLAKLSLWDDAGRLIERRTRANACVDTGDYLALDVGGIDAWMAEVLSDVARIGRVGTIVPVAHGAAVAVLRSGQLACPPMDYETPIPADERAAYEAARDAFALTGSPSLPDGLNFGIQLHYLEALNPGLLAEGATILPWAQYWAWRLCGVAACEVTSLGCHSDIWRPLAASPSALATSRGWARRLAPLRRADEALGPLAADWVERTGLAEDVRILCGVHDSNAALLAARGFPEIAGQESTVISTGTWFVAMRTPGSGAVVDISRLAEARDCLVNVDVQGAPVPSARFMGGREIEVLTGPGAGRIDSKPDQTALIAAAHDAVASGAMVLPSFAPGFGPFGHGRGRWINRPIGHAARGAAICLYAALVADTSLNLIGARERILIEGRFAQAEVFVRALAALRPNDRIYVSTTDNDVSYGALRLVDPTLTPATALTMVKPLDVDLTAYRQAWLRAAQRMDAQA
jgi:sugar (pentulose or hexulose) kinase